MLRVMSIAGEPTRFHVESNSLQCVDPKCARLFNRKQRPELHVGGSCPRCGGQLDLRFHLVDLEPYNGVGQCSCEFFQFTLEPKLRRTPPAERMAAPFRLRCSHIHAARDFALDVAVELNRRERMIHAHGRREEVQP